MGATSVDCACCDCGHEQMNMDPCEKCGSLRVVTVDFLDEVAGPNWREECFGEEDGA